jgi:carboxylesterase type B
VTIFGQSAGGSSVAFHLASPNSYNTGYFQKVIMQSNPIAIYYKTVAQANTEGMALATKLNCTDANTYDNLTQAEAQAVVACMRAIPADAIAAISHDVGMGYEPLLPHVVDNVYDWSPYLDNNWLYGQPLDLMLQAKVANVSLMIGTTHDEALQWVYQPIKVPVTDLEFDVALVAIFGENGPAIGKQYPIPQALRNDTRPVMADIGTAYTFHCGMRAGTAALAPVLPEVYLYTFDHILSYKECWGPEFVFCEDAVCHG